MDGRVTSTLALGRFHAVLVEDGRGTPSSGVGLQTRHAEYYDFLVNGDLTDEAVGWGIQTDSDEGEFILTQAIVNFGADYRK